MRAFFTPLDIAYRTINNYFNCAERSGIIVIAMIGNKIQEIINDIKTSAFLPPSTSRMKLSTSLRSRQEDIQAYYKLSYGRNWLKISLSWRNDLFGGSEFLFLFYLPPHSSRNRWVALWELNNTVQRDLLAKYALTNFQSTSFPSHFPWELTRLRIFWLYFSSSSSQSSTPSPSTLLEDVVKQGSENGKSPIVSIVVKRYSFRVLSNFYRISQDQQNKINFSQYCFNFFFFSKKVFFPISRKSKVNSKVHNSFLRFKMISS